MEIKATEFHLGEKAKGIISYISKNVGEYEDKSFFENTMSGILIRDMTSPIEQILFFALCALRKINNLKPLTIFPQYEIGKYRVDFFIEKEMSTDEYRQLIVECDSQIWHENTEKERKYEKKRDRYFISKGYKVFHFTGTEIMQNYYKIAKEILEEIIDEEIFIPYET